LQVLDIPYLLSTHNVLNVPPQEKIKWRDLGVEVARVLVHPFQSRHQGISNLKRHTQSN